MILSRFQERISFLSTASFLKLCCEIGGGGSSDFQTSWLSRAAHEPTAARVSRRQVLKASLIGWGGLAAATGLAPLESLVAAPASAPGGWRRLFPKSTPSPRNGAAMAYDAARQMIVLFGGPLEDTDTWIWDGRAWNRLSPPFSPPARSGASLAYHPPTETSVLFGGGGAKAYLGDTWLWNGSTWTAVLGDGPPARSSASMAFDPASGGLILFGGYGSGVLDDTWMWNGKSWIRLSPRSSPRRFGASLAYHSGMGKLILFGGKSMVLGGFEPKETWAWDGTNWSQLSLDHLPPWRVSASMAEASGGVLLFGGFDGSALGDTWILGSTWSEVTQTLAPSPRMSASLALNPSGNSLLLFGGGTPGRSGRSMGDTWIWEFS